MVFVIAEAGVNHNGSQAQAFKLIDAAKEAGADAVKFQTYQAEKLEPPGPRREMLKALEFTHQGFATIKQHCDGLGIEFMSTPFDVESLEFLVGLGVKRIKIASGAPDELFNAAYETGLPLIASTGMGCETFYDARITWLHCVSAYPAPASEMNLSALGGMYRPHGLSDHTLGNTAAIAATALGASVIEKHITLDSGMDGPDHHMSTEPDEFAAYVKAIRECELMLGDGIKRVMPSEAKTLQIVKEREAWRALS